MKDASEKSVILKCANCGGGAVTINETSIYRSWQCSDCGMYNHYFNTKGCVSHTARDTGDMTPEDWERLHDMEKASMTPEQRRRHREYADFLFGDGEKGTETEFEFAFHVFRVEHTDAAARFGDSILTAAFRMVFDALREGGRSLVAEELAEDLIADLAAGGATLYGPIREGLPDLMEAILADLAGSFDYVKSDVFSTRDEIARILWPHVARTPDPEAAAGALADAILEYYRGHAALNVTEAAAYVTRRCPDTVTFGEMEKAVEKVFALLSEKGFMKLT